LTSATAVHHRRGDAGGLLRSRTAQGLDHCIARGLAFAPHADLIWFETSHPNIDEARTFAEGIHAKYPGMLLAYNCSPSFNWKAKLDEQTIANFQRELGAMGYKYQFVTLAGFHSLNHAMFELASAYRDRGMAGLFRAAAGRVRQVRRPATPRPGTSAKSAPAISTRSRPPSPAASRRPWRSGIDRNSAVRRAAE
jgi:isocitrate lyase